MMESPGFSIFLLYHSAQATRSRIPSKKHGMKSSKLQHVSSGNQTHKNSNDTKIIDSNLPTPPPQKKPHDSYLTTSMKSFLNIKTILLHSSVIQDLMRKPPYITCT